MKSVLTIAGSDPSGGAGIQADLRAFSYAGVRGCSVVTCVTAQNAREVRQIHEVPLETIEAQIDSVLEDRDIQACKTGMLYSPGIAQMVAKKSRDWDFPLVVDPVMKASAGQDLSSEGFIDAVIKSLIPKATLFTPNIFEAEAITDGTIRTLDDMEDACRHIQDMGCRYILLKGGHLEELKATDVLFDGQEFRLFISKSYPYEVHGSGCTLSALISAFLARGMKIEDAVEEAKLHMGSFFAQGFAFGAGMAEYEEISEPNLSQEQVSVLEALSSAAEEVVELLPADMVPEVGINFGYALEHAENTEDVCALEGRLMRVGDRVGHLGGFAFGASKHVARIILTAMRYEESARSAMNLRYRSDIVHACVSAGLNTGMFDRKLEPRKSSTMEWGMRFAIKQLGYVPDIVYDKGGMGKEPMIRVIGSDPNDVITKLRLILKNIEEE